MVSSKELEKERAQLKKSLKAYQYVSPPLSMAERLFLNDFWGKVSTMYPMWLAPNMVTLMGFIAQLLSFIPMLYLSPRFDGKTELWFCLFLSVCTFVYQTCDGSDGKQARRTKAGSPLGELFDHGVDAVVFSIIFVSATEIAGLGVDSTIVTLCFFAGQAAFFTSNLTLLHCGRQHFNEIDAQEFQVFMQGLGVFTFACGREAFGAVVPVPAWLHSTFQGLPAVLQEGGHAEGGITASWLLCVANLAFVLLNVAQAVLRVTLYYTQAERPQVEGRGLLAMASQLAAMVLLQASGTAAWWFARMDTTDAYAMVSWLLVMQIAFGHLMAHVLVTRVGQLPFPSLLGAKALWMNLAILSVNSAAAAGLVTGLAVVALRWAVVFGSMGVYLKYVVHMGRTIASCLGIQIFTIAKAK